MADEYGVGRTQIQQTLKRKAEYMTAYEDNASSCCKRLCTRLISDDLENSAWSWFEKARSMNIPVSGPMLQERALLTAERLELKARADQLFTIHSLRCTASTVLHV